MKKLYENDDLDYEDDQFDPKKLPLDQLLMRYVTQLIFFFFSYDPFAIYKKNHKQSSRSKYESYLVPNLRIETTTIDKWRLRWRKVSICWLNYLLLKYIILCSLQLIIYNVLSSDSGLDTGVWLNGTKTTTTGEGEISDEQSTLICALKLKYYGELLGNILSDYPGIALVVYSSLFVSVSFAMYYLPNYYFRKPMDAIVLRLAFDPKREIRRVDALLKEILTSFLSIIDRCQLRVLNPNYQRSSLTSSASLSAFNLNNFSKSLYFSRQFPRLYSNTFKPQFEPHKSLRPINYTHTFYIFMWGQARKVAYSIALLMILFFLDIQVIWVKASISIRCETKHIYPCEAFEALSLQDWLSLGELLLQMYITGHIVTVQIIMIFMTAISQLLIAQEMKYELKCLLAELKLINDGDDGRAHGSMELSGKESQEKANTHLAQKLLRTLVKVSVQSRDLKTEALFMTEHVSSILGINGCMLLIALLTGRMKVIDMQGLRVTIVIGVWIAGNLVVIRCASVYARIVQVNGTIWSIAAQLARRSTKSKARNYSNKPPAATTKADIAEDYLVSYWQRLILGENLINQDNSVRPLGICLTYKKVLEINFFIISLVALLRPNQH